MLNVNTYIDKAREYCTKFIDNSMFSIYPYNGKCHKVMKDSLHLCLLNGCKAILCKYGDNFGCTSDDEIIKYTYSTYSCARGIEEILNKERKRDLAVKNNDKIYYNQYDCFLASDLKHFVNFLNEEVRE